MNRATVVGTGVLILALGVAVGSAFGTPQMLAEAKKAGIQANNCQYCHTQPLPKKETFKPDELSDRGKFLLADMKQRNLKAPDVTKLKEYKDTK